MRRLFFTLAAVLIFAGNVFAQSSTSAATTYAVRDSETKEGGNPVDALVQFFDPDTVIDYRVSVAITDSAANRITFDVTVGWKGGNFTQSGITVPIDAQFVFPVTSWKQDRIPDSVFALTWDEPGDGDTYSYLSQAQTEPIFNSGSNGLVTMQSIHHVLHDGYFFTAYVDSVMATANDSLEIAIITPSDKGVHLWWDASVSAKCWFYVKTGPTLSVVADTIASFNSNYQSSNTSEAVLIKAPRTDTTGTLKRVNLIGSDRKAGGDSAGINGVILKKGTTYVFGVASTSAADATIILRWKEKGSK